MKTIGFTLSRFCFILIAAITFGATLCANALENEVWISPIGPATTTGTIIGTPTYPFRCPDGATLNYVLNTLLGNNMTIHLMAGNFTVSNNITMKPGWRLMGAGMNDTVLTLQSNTGVAPQVFVIGGPPAYIPQTDGAEISDLTVDCNLQNQSGFIGWIGSACINGSNTRISKVKGIDWGTTSGEGFNIVLAPGSATVVSNRIIEDCVVTQPAPIIFGGDDGGVCIFPDQSPTEGDRDSVVRNNLAIGVHSGLGTAGSPAWFGAYGGVGVISHNRAIDLTGGYGFYWDTSTTRDLVIEDNTFDNVGYGIFINLQTGNSTNFVIKNNVIRPAEGGIGIAYYTGESTNTNAMAQNLMITGNIIYPSATATNVVALSLNTYISAIVMNNVFQGGGTGGDIFVNWADDPNTVPGLQLNTWSGNVNMAGRQAVVASGDPVWQPGTQDTIKFTPTTAGWYRVLSGVAALSAAVQLDVGGITSYHAWNSGWTDTEFWFRVNTYTTNSASMGELGITRRGSQFYAGAGPVTAARIVSDYPSTVNVYLDLYIPNVSGANTNEPIIVTSRGGQLRGRLYTSPALITGTPAVSQQLNF